MLWIQGPFNSMAKVQPSEKFNKWEVGNSYECPMNACNFWNDVPWSTDKRHGPPPNKTRGKGDERTKVDYSWDKFRQIIIIYAHVKLWNNGIFLIFTTISGCVSWHRNISSKCQSIGSDWATIHFQCFILWSQCFVRSTDEFPHYQEAHWQKHSFSCQNDRFFINKSMLKPLFLDFRV